MSSTSPLRRSALPRLAPRAAVNQVRLRVVPRLGLRSTAPRVPFVTLVSVLLLSGVIGLLLFNTSMQQASFDQTRLGAQEADLSARLQALQLREEKLADPQRIALLARRQNMVPAPGSAFLDVETAKVTGTPVVATLADNVPVRAPAIAPPPGIDPPPRVLGAKPNTAKPNAAKPNAGKQKQQTSPRRSGEPRGQQAGNSQDGRGRR